MIANQSILCVGFIFIICDKILIILIVYLTTEFIYIQEEFIKYETN